MKILVTDPNLVPHRARFEAAVPPQCELRWLVGAEPDVVLEELRDTEVYVGGRFTAAMASAAEKLRLIHIVGAGTDRIDFAALPAHVSVANTFHHERSIAEYVVAATVMLRRHFPVQDRELRRGVWATSVYNPAIPQAMSLQDAKIGFVGFGHIGQRSWDLLRVFGAVGAAVTGSGRLDAATHGLLWSADVGELERLMSESDVVVVSAPLTPATENMIGAAELRALGPDGVLVNVGRGPLVDERALYDALVERQIRAAAIDVWYRYPGPDGRGTPSDLPFGELSNILMTPHSSGVTSNTFIGRLEDVAANIDRLLRGEAVHNLVNR